MATLFHGWLAMLARATPSKRAYAIAPNAHWACRIGVRPSGVTISTTPQSPGSLLIDGAAFSEINSGRCVHGPIAAQVTPAASHSVSMEIVAPSKSGTYRISGKNAGSAIMALL